MSTDRATQPDVTVRIVVPHDDLDGDDFHEWWHPREPLVKADRLGRPNPRMMFASWQEWRCNNTDCAAVALVSEDAVVALIEAEERS